MDGEDNNYLENKEKEKERQKNVAEYKRKFLNKKTGGKYYGKQY